MYRVAPGFVYSCERTARGVTGCGPEVGSLKMKEPDWKSPALVASDC